LRRVDFNPEDGGSMFFQNVGIRLESYTVQQPRRSHSNLMNAPKATDLRLGLSQNKLFQKRKAATNIFYINYHPGAT
jgi:hypothetical protein